MSGLIKYFLKLLLAVLNLPCNFLKKRTFSMTKVKRILLSALNAGLGNAVLMIPLIKTLKDNFPDKEIFIVCRSAVVAELFSRLPFINKVLLAEFRKGKELLHGIIFFKKKIRPLKIDMYISHFLDNMLDFSIWGFFSGAKYRITYNNRLDGCLDTFFLYNDRSMHEVERNLEIAKFLEVKDISDHIDLKTCIREAEFAKQFLNLPDKEKDWILLGIHPGCDKRNAYKRWPIERFISIGRLFSQRPGRKVIFFIGPDEMDLLTLLDPVKDDKILVCSGLRLWQTIAVISMCDIFLSNDSALMHIAAFLQIPVVALFGLTSPTKNRPWKVKHILLKKVNREDITSLNDFQKSKTMMLIEESEVMSEINSLLSYVREK